MAVHRDGDLDVLPQFRNQIGHGLGDDDSDSIGNVDGAGSRILYRLVDGFHELQVGTGGVLAGELHLQTVLACVFHGFHGLRPDLLGGHLQLVLHVQVGGRDEGVDVIASAVYRKIRRLASSRDYLKTTLALIKPAYLLHIIK